MLIYIKEYFIYFSKISDWQAAISLLVQDGNEVMLDSKRFSMIDPYEVARTHGFLKNKIIRLINSERKAAMREQKERSRYIKHLNNINKEKKIINPWYLNYGSENEDYLKKHTIKLLENNFTKITN